MTLAHITELPQRRRLALYLAAGWTVALIAVVIPLAVVGDIQSWPIYSQIWIGVTNGIAAAVVTLEVLRYRVRSIAAISEETHSLLVQALFGVFFLVQILAFLWLT